MRLAAISLVALAVGACATVPTGPTVRVLPGSTKTYAQFRADDAACRNDAFRRIGGTGAAAAASDNAVRSGVAGAAIGAIAGAAIGGSRGAGVGAGTGLIVGSASGAGASQYSGYASQRAFDDAYVQCMYAMGHRVPVAGAYSRSAPRYVPSGTAPSGAAYGSVPPPPLGAPPAPPPR